MSHTKEIMDMIGMEITAYPDDAIISAEIIADRTIVKLDPHNETESRIRWGCILQIRQWARTILRKGIEEANSRQGELFEFQERYPSADNPGEYVPFNRMDWMDFTVNIERFEKKAEGEQYHADRLREERSIRFPQGPNSPSSRVQA